MGNVFAVAFGAIVTSIVSATIGRLAICDRGPSTRGGTPPVAETRSETRASEEETKTCEEETGYYYLPSPESCARVIEQAEQEDLISATSRSDNGPKSSSLECGSREGGRCHLCVCCYTRPNSFMFVSCRHLCLCEKCLIQLGRSYENNTLHSRFKGPVRLPCPLCRTVGYVVKTFIP
ncbi:uncharacterized protein JKF63_07975 [Porcisia hertigi]|uniref:RING-type domain-containing protein n=1 Tax=Porcisia hertigi TaxID=2761500 RepID=A0A836I4R9_9TRYP|nr:hypothetical protein JKF63_07975 [Porcisia hertigi]